MCGIFGFAVRAEDHWDQRAARQLTARLFRLSETRGREASGLVIMPIADGQSIYVHKSSQPASDLIKTHPYDEFWRASLPDHGAQPVAALVFGHTRLVTNGCHLKQDNNQPVEYEGGLAVHNGIIVNVDELWRDHPDMERHCEVDTEVLVALIRRHYRQHRDPAAAVRHAFGLIKGTASIAMTVADLNILVLATNNGSLYLGTSGGKMPILFASEQHMLDQLLKSREGARLQGLQVAQVPPRSAVIVDLNRNASTAFDFSATPVAGAWEPLPAPRTIKYSYSHGEVARASVIEIKKVQVPREFDELFERAVNAVKHLRRCAKCLLPETYPYITFNAEGICNQCTQYVPKKEYGRAALEQYIAPFRKKGTAADCVMGISGGRDSCFALQYAVKDLKLKPVTYTYDWGMVTDLARRNISRMCAELGVENIVVSADISWKRMNIRKNIEAWLKRPHIGMVPLFMAGDKQWLWHAYRLKKQMGIGFDILATNRFEHTPFKEDYMGIKVWDPKKETYCNKLELINRLKVLFFYGKQFLLNPGYLNQSLWDSFTGYLSYYFGPKDYILIYEYIPWNEKEIENTLIRQYDWETARDCPSTWRIGDGTASFYNYIYFLAGGFTENDTFRSNLVREGQMTRADALALVERENRPRWETIKWYCDIVGIDFESTIRRINAMPGRYVL